MSSVDRRTGADRGGALTCLVLAAAGSSGKSTLTAALLARGYRYLSDDVVPLQRGRGLAIPVPVCLNLKPGSVSVLAELYPELPKLPVWQDGERQLRFLPPPDFAARRPVGPYPVAALVRSDAGVLPCLRRYDGGNRSADGPGIRLRAGRPPQPAPSPARLPGPGRSSCGRRRSDTGPAAARWRP